MDDPQPDSDFADIFEVDVYGERFRASPVYGAIVACDASALLSVIYGPEREEIYLVDDIFGSTFIHLIVSTAESPTEDRFVPLLYVLSNAWVDVNAVDFAGLSPLQISIKKNLFSLAVALHRCGAERNSAVDLTLMAEHGGPWEAEMSFWYDRFSPGLWDAVRANDYNLVCRLVSFWNRIRIRRGDQSLIAFARESGAKAAIVELLESRRATLEFVHATLAGDERKMLEILNNKNVDTDVVDMSGFCTDRLGATSLGNDDDVHGRTLRHTALSMGHHHVLYLLPERKKRLLNTDSLANFLLCDGPNHSSQAAGAKEYGHDTPKKQQSSVCCML